MKKTNYDNIEGKSVWDLYVENFRDHIWDLAPKFAFNPFRVLTSEEEEELEAKAGQLATELKKVKAKKVKAKLASKKAKKSEKEDSQQPN